MLLTTIWNHDNGIKHGIIDVKMGGNENVEVRLYLFQRGRIWYSKFQ